MFCGRDGGLLRYDGIDVKLCVICYHFFMLFYDWIYVFFMNLIFLCVISISLSSDIFS